MPIILLIMKLEELFQKINKENMSFGRHKEELRALLLSRDYFRKEKEQWDWKLSMSSLAFSAFLLIFTSVFPVYSDNSMLSSLEKNINVNSLGSDEWAGQGVKVYEMVEQETKTLFYFDSRNDVLVHSEVYNK